MPSRKSPPLTYRRAHHLRHEATETEAKLWTYLRSHRLNNIHFRRQHTIGKYIVDFCAPRQKLIIELDGSQHLNCIEQDELRSIYLASKGYRVIRFWNNDITNDFDNVIIAIEQALLEDQKKE